MAVTSPFPRIPSRERANYILSILYPGLIHCVNVLNHHNENKKFEKRLDGSARKKVNKLVLLYGDL